MVETVGKPGQIWEWLTASTGSVCVRLLELDREGRWMVEVVRGNNLWGSGQRLDSWMADAALRDSDGLIVLVEDAPPPSCLCGRGALEEYDAWACPACVQEILAS